jgi:hypothetical protein
VCHPLSVIREREHVGSTVLSRSKYQRVNTPMYVGKEVLYLYSNDDGGLI